MFGSHVRRVFFFENGTLFPYCLVFPWNRPSCDLLNGWLSAAASEGKEGNMGRRGLTETALPWERSERQLAEIGKCEPRPLTSGHKCNQFFVGLPRIVFVCSFAEL